MQPVSLNNASHVAIFVDGQVVVESIATFMYQLSPDLGKRRMAILSALVVVGCVGCRRSSITKIAACISQERFDLESPNDVTSYFPWEVIEKKLSKMPPLMALSTFLCSV